MRYLKKILLIGLMLFCFLVFAEKSDSKKDIRTVMYEACLKGVEENVKKQSDTKNLDELVKIHEASKKACHCMANDPEIMKAAASLASLQAKGKTPPFKLSESYQALLLKTKSRCFSKQES